MGMRSLPKTKTSEEPQAKSYQSEKGVCIFFFLSSPCPIYCLQPVYINASPLTTDCNITPSSSSILLLPALLLTAIHIPALCLTYIADRLGNLVLEDDDSMVANTRLRSLFFLLSQAILECWYMHVSAFRHYFLPLCIRSFVF